MSRYEYRSIVRNDEREQRGKFRRAAAIAALYAAVYSLMLVSIDSMPAAFVMRMISTVAVAVLPPLLKKLYKNWQETLERRRNLIPEGRRKSL